MDNTRLEAFFDLVTEAHTLIQQDFAHINPVVGVNQKMRNAGIAADVITVDCLKTKKRIIMILQDAEPEIIHYQFTFKDQDPDDAFMKRSATDFTAPIIYKLIIDYFSGSEA